MDVLTFLRCEIFVLGDTASDMTAESFHCVSYTEIKTPAEENKK